MPRSSEIAAAGDGGDVFQHGLAAIAEARSLDGRNLEAAAQLVDDESGERLPLDVLGDDEQRLAGLHDRFKQRQQRLQAAELLLMDQDVRVFQLDQHLLGIGDEVRREIAAVELHALDDLELCLQALALLDSDDAFVADALHRLRELGADLGVAVGRDGADLGDLVIGSDLLGLRLQLFDDGRNSLIDAAAQVHRVGAGSNRLGAFLDDRLGEHGGGGGAVAGEIGGLRGDLLEHLGAHVLELVLKLDFFGDGHAVLRDARGAIRLVEHDVAALGTERDFHGVGEDVDAAQHTIARVLTEFDVFRGHGGATPGNLGVRRRDG